MFYLMKAVSQWNFLLKIAEIFRRVDLGISSVVTRLDRTNLKASNIQPEELRDEWDRARLRGASVSYVEGERLPESLRFVDLFAGCGGMSFGVREAATAAGLDSQAVLAVDNDGYALEILSK